MKKGLACLAYSQKYITLYESTLEKRKKKKKQFLIFNDIHNFLLHFIISAYLI